MDLSRPLVMGVLNVTQDSFSDGGKFLDPDAAFAHAERMSSEGAAIIDIGGESTRPGAAGGVSSEEELRRVLPVVERIAARLKVLISVDTSNPELMSRAPAAGAHLINDVRALQRPGALEAAASTPCGVCLMHMLGEPHSMQVDPHYQDVVKEVRAFLQDRVQACVDAGIARERLCVDPGFGFGKRLEHNLQLLRKLPQLESLHLPVVVGLSRKSMLATLLGRKGDAGSDRLAASLALATAAVLQGAHIVRAHDVAQTVDAVRVASAIHYGSPP
ncbi:MAG TPA: dihydropteroate synthase [Steroidobacteraceae bacterium]|nr:dihydropteroate synthase [Steroidobacteraceae bacterium]